MKTLSLFLAAALSIAVLAGCNAENNTETQELKENETSSSNEEGQNISALVGLQMKMIQTIRKDLALVTRYENSGDEALQEEAVEASKKIANGLRGIEIPSDLSKDLQGDIKESIELLAIYFEERAATLTSAGDSTEMDEAFAAFHENIGAVFKKAGLHAPNFEKDVY